MSLLSLKSTIYLILESNTLKYFNNTLKCSNKEMSEIFPAMKWLNSHSTVTHVTFEEFLWDINVWFNHFLNVQKKSLCYSFPLYQTKAVI